MGNSASKQRQLGLQVSKGVSETINRTKNLKQLPPQELRDRVEQKLSEPNPATNVKFDAKALKKRLDGKQQVIPEGKDGFDPQVEGTSTYDTDFLKSINHLGKQIQSVEVKQNFNKNALPLRQLRQRKDLYVAGEKNKLDLEHDNTTIHPQTLTSILNDIHDPRMSEERIMANYKIDKEFMAKLGRFRVAKNVVLMEEDTKSGEIGHKTNVARSPEYTDDYSDANVSEEGHIARPKLNKLKQRISMDD